jgi:hypothetical protein
MTASVTCPACKKKHKTQKKMLMCWHRSFGEYLLGLLLLPECHKPDGGQIFHGDVGYRARALRRFRAFLAPLPYE